MTERRVAGGGGGVEPEVYSSVDHNHSLHDDREGCCTASQVYWIECE